VDVVADQGAGADPHRRLGVDVDVVVEEDVVVDRERADAAEGEAGADLDPGADPCAGGPEHPCARARGQPGPGGGQHHELAAAGGRHAAECGPRRPAVCPVCPVFTR
jgi:hypothetical protein